LAGLGAFLVIADNSLVTWQWPSNMLVPGLAALGAAAVWGISSLFSLAALKENSHQFVTVSRFIGGALLALICIPIVGNQPMTHALAIPNVHTAMILIVLGVIAALVSIFIYFRALKEISNQVSIFLQLLVPVGAFVVDIVLYHHFPSVIQLIGMVTILIATVRITTLHDFSSLAEN
jgi:drug/metabolite transporter (DMT)-like permease